MAVCLLAYNIDSSLDWNVGKQRFNKEGINDTTWGSGT